MSLAPCMALMDWSYVVFLQFVGTYPTLHTIAMAVSVQLLQDVCHMDC